MLYLNKSYMQRIHGCKVKSSNIRKFFPFQGIIYCDISKEFIFPFPFRVR